MKIKNTTKLLTLVVLILMAACVASAPVATPAAISTPTRTPFPVPTKAPTQMPTRKPIPTSTPVPTEPPTHPPTTPPETQSEGLQTYTGQGFSFQYPVNAQLETFTDRPPATQEVHILGPRVSVKPGDADWVYVGSGYEMIVRTYDNPEGLDAESWTRNHLLTSWQEAKERDEPRGSFPVSEEGKIDESQVGRAVVAGYPAFWVDYLAFDSYVRAFYLVREYRVVEMSFSDYPLANQPMDLVQQDMYALIMSTFRLDGE
jgi:hypothetical protein